MRAILVAIACIALCGCAHQPTKVVGAKPVSKADMAKLLSKKSGEKPAKRTMRAGWSMRTPGSVTPLRTGHTVTIDDQPKKTSAEQIKTLVEKAIGKGSGTTGGGSTSTGIKPCMTGVKVCDPTSPLPPAPDTPQLKPLDSMLTSDEGQVAARVLDPGIKGIVPVYFQTNRKIKEGPFSIDQVTYERSQTSSFGLVQVSVPIAHKMGSIERPGRTYWGTREPEKIAKHFTIYKMSRLNYQEFVAAMKPAQSLMLFVHGYNVSFADAAFSAAQLAFDAKYKGRVVMFSWPSKGGLLDYDYDRESAVFSSDALFELLTIIKSKTKISRIIVVAHSLGSEVVIGALHQAAQSATKLGITELIFAASDVSRDLYVKRGKQIRAAAKHVTLYASSTDWALLASLAKAQSGSRMGYVLNDVPTLVDGIETIDVSSVGSHMFALNHSTYAKSRAVLDDIGRILFRSDHPPHARTVTFELKPDEKNVKYWRYPD